MREPESHSRRIWPICAVSLLLAVVAVVWGVSAQTEQAPASTLPSELSVDNLKAQMKDDPSKLREAMRRDDLTEEQRREFQARWAEALGQQVDAQARSAAESRPGKRPPAGAGRNGP